MVILLYGPESYSRSKKILEIVDAKLKTQYIILERFDFEEDNGYLKFKDFLSARSMFNPKKIGILDNAFETKEKKEFKKTIEALIEDKETLLIIVSDTKPPASFAFLLDKREDKLLTNQYFADFKKGEELRSFIKKEAAVRSIDLKKEEIEAIEDAYGNNVWALVTELDKLALQTKRDIQSGSSSDYFKTINAFKAGKTVKDRILNLEILLSERGDEPAKIFNMLGFGFATSGLIDQLADYDVMVKSGKLDYEEVLLDLALKS